MNIRTCQVLRPIIAVLLLAVLLSAVPTASAATREEQLQAKIQQIIDGIPASADTDAKVALYLHDYIVYHVSYEMVGDHQTAYGALLDGKAVCAGYADAYLRLLTAAGIRAYTIYGTADNGNGDRVSHAWTMLYLNGVCLFTDVTWDDPFVNGVQSNDNISYSYFQLSMEQMHRDHFPDDASKAVLPSKCNHTGYDYYSVMQGEGTGCGVFNSSTTPQEAARYFVYKGKNDGSDVFFCDFRFDGTDMLDWISKNWADIAVSLGLTGGLSVSYQYGENYAKLTLKGTLNNKVDVTGVSLDPSSLVFQAAGLTAQLTASISPSNATDKNVTYHSSDPTVATVSSTGLVTARSNGSAVITVRTNDGGKTASCTVTVSIPVPPEPTGTTASTEPTETTGPNIQTDPTEITEPPVPSNPEGGDHSIPTEPAEGADPTNTSVPSMGSTEPSQMIPTATTEPTGTKVTLPSDSADATSPISRPSTPSPMENGSISPVLTTVLIVGGVGILVFLLIFVLKRR
jgi:uncharacterized protein YjdB